VKELAEPLAGLTGREAAFPNASPEAGSGEFKTERGNRSGFPVGPLPLVELAAERRQLNFRKGLVRVCPGGIAPGALPRSSVGCADPKIRRNASDPAYGPRSRSGGVLFSPVPGFRLNRVLRSFVP